MANVKSLSMLVVLISFSLALAMPLTSAFSIDNFKEDIAFSTDKNLIIGTEELSYNSIWEIYSPIEIKNMFGFGKTLFSGALTQHTDTCGIECSSTMQIYLAEDSVLIDDIIFKTLQTDGSWVEQNVRSYQFTINGERYSIGEEIEAGTYEVRLNAEKKPSRTVDWIIETNGEWLDEWAVWGNISEGDDAEVILNSPVDNYVSDIFSVTFNCSANVTGGASLTNISLWTNESGTWEIENITLAEGGTLNDDDSFTNPTNLFDWNDITYAQKAYSNQPIDTTYDVSIGQNFSSRYVGDVRINTTMVSVDTYSDEVRIYLQGYNGATWSNIATLVAAGGAGTNIYDDILSLNVTTQGLRIYYQWRITGDPTTSVDIKSYVLKYGDFSENATEGTTTLAKIISGSDSWTCQACDSDGDCGFATENRTVYLDVDAPVINITYPTAILDYGYIGENVSLNWTVADTNLEQCWYNYNNTNTTVTCADNNASFIIESGNYTITFYANDSVANEANYTRSWTNKLFGNSETYNLTTYETAGEGFRINITSDGTQTVTADLVYDGTAYTGTKVGNNSEMEFNRNIIISEVDIATAQNRSFYWNVTYGAEAISTTITNQTVDRIALGLCNSTLTVPYINFTFKDEETSVATNATIDSSTWYYYLGDGSVNKSLLYSTTDANESYGFCFIPSDKTMKNLVSIQYSDTGYPQRRWNSDTALTNTTTNQNLYMLSSADGTYSVYQVQTATATSIEGVTAKVERQFAGVWTLVEEGVTGSGGAVTFWLNPDYDHRLTFTKEGYTTVQVTVRPSSSTYTVVMETGEVEEAIYNSSMEGLSWKVYPNLGQVLFPNTTQTFLFNITANLSNIDSCKMELINNNSVSLGSTIGCTSGGGNLSLSIPLGVNRSVRGVYSVDIGNGYFVLDADAYWIVMDTNIPERGTLVAFFKYARNLNEFGSDANRQEFSRIVFFFLILAIIMASISVTTGWDLTSAGGALVFMNFIILLGSYGGFLTLSYTGVNGWMDQHVVALITSLFTAGFILNKMAREA